MGFRKDFIWGAATASYQVEGGKDCDGKGLSIWDVFTEKKSNIIDGSNGDIACDHYHKYKEDVRLMAEMGLNAYRFSTSWSRIIPEGVGKINSKGLDFYDKLVDELLKNNIDPFITLYHWDLPYALQLRGGFANREIADWFGEYAAIVAKKLGDRVKHFITANEPQVFIGAGYCSAEHAPGIKCSLREELNISHNFLLAHGKAVLALRANCNAEVGYASAGCPALPQKVSDYETAKKLTFAYDPIRPSSSVAMFADAMILGDYDKQYYEMYKDFLPDIKAGDMKIISSPIDFYGQNCYAGMNITTGAGGKAEILKENIGAPHTNMGWNIESSSLYWFSKMLYERYKLPVYITENGVSFTDILSKDKKVHDGARIEYMNSYIRELRRAAEDNIDVRGYFVWSLLDNFEWGRGYTQRFGLIYLDYLTGERILKDSANYYKKIIETNGDIL